MLRNNQFTKLGLGSKSRLQIVGVLNSRNSLLALLILLIVLIVPPTLDPIYDYSAATLILLTLILISLFQKRAVVHLARPSLIWLVCFIPLLSTFVVNPIHYGFFQGALVPLLFIVLGYLLLVPLIRHKTDLILNLLVYISVPLFILALWQYITNSWPIIDGISQPEFTSAAFENRSAATFGHPILYGTYCSAVIIIAAFHKPKYRWPIIMLNVLGILLSGSRSSILPLAIVFLMTMAHHIKQVLVRKQAPISQVLHFSIFLILASGLCILVSQSLLTIPERYVNTSESYSATYRTLQWSAGFKLIVDTEIHTWLGHGAGGSAELFSRGPIIGLWGPKTFDNAYITLLYDYGILGTFSLILPTLYRIYSTKQNLSRFLLIFASINALFYDAFLWPVWIFLIFIALALQTSHRVNHQRV